MVVLGNLKRSEKQVKPGRYVVGFFCGARAFQTTRECSKYPENVACVAPAYGHLERGPELQDPVCVHRAATV